MDSPLKVFPAHEQKFYKLFHDFIDTFNSFDENLSICLGLIVSGGQPHLAYPVIEKLSTNEKLDSLKKILNSKVFEDKKTWLIISTGGLVMRLKLNASEIIMFMQGGKF